MKKKKTLSSIYLCKNSQVLCLWHFCGMCVIFFYLVAVKSKTIAANNLLNDVSVEEGKCGEYEKCIETSLLLLLLLVFFY